jgi:simple sugar transport system ATP-binding protein
MPSAGRLEWAPGAGGRPVAYIPDDPRSEALVPGMPVLWNLGMRHYRDVTRGVLLDFRRLRELAARCLEQFDVRGAGLDARAGELSGGNLQKLVLARELSFGARVIIAVNPTAGLDVASAAYVHEKLAAERAGGAALLLVSGDLDEVFKLSDRIVVMYRGGFASDTARDATSREQVGRLMSGIGVASREAGMT